MVLAVREHRFAYRAQQCIHCYDNSYGKVYPCGTLNVDEHHSLVIYEERNHTDEHYRRYYICLLAKPSFVAQLFEKEIPLASDDASRHEKEYAVYDLCNDICQYEDEQNKYERVNSACNVLGDAELSEQPSDFL